MQIQRTIHIRNSYPRVFGKASQLLDDVKAFRTEYVELKREVSENISIVGLSSERRLSHEVEGMVLKGLDSSYNKLQNLRKVWKRLEDVLTSTMAVVIVGVVADWYLASVSLQRASKIINGFVPYQLLNNYEKVALITSVTVTGILCTAMAIYFTMEIKIAKLTDEFYNISGRICELVSSPKKTNNVIN